MFIIDPINLFLIPGEECISVPILVIGFAANNHLVFFLSLFGGRYTEAYN